VFAFVNTGVSEATGLVANIQRLVNDPRAQGLKACVVFVGGPSLKGQIEKLGAAKRLTFPLVYLPGGKKDPALPRYKINPTAKTTILVTRSNTVRANFVNVDDKQFAKVAAAAKKML
jgi:hypothetical protein